MIAVEPLGALRDKKTRRREPHGDDVAMLLRPDSGHELLNDVGRGTHPGYPVIGRMRGVRPISAASSRPSPHAEVRHA